MPAEAGETPFDCGPGTPALIVPTPADETPVEVDDGAEVDEPRDVADDGGIAPVRAPTERQARAAGCCARTRFGFAASPNVRVREARGLPAGSRVIDGEEG